MNDNNNNEVDVAKLVSAIVLGYVFILVLALIL